ncbi:bis(5'-nucleosyl)-tetraphosphatase (symmetrical) YqeK [Anaerococcus sp. AGMB00486]|uniref:bis(5'-nucleosyl)-tetraphosphatase (symmetrical) n=2 Tax=Anaerococcus TaxID=165779 RepID=A0ABX2N7W2_9FIRM|nr:MULTISPECIES: bis(5'-nucleosyl)-tetraphosphatase (symmetrical) YqeK [Anaerococcus]MDY3005471.1 bis(5'-nucleosyl)-tetraphosphatase (symmetrical) YqeK [Anaerococcus porci]MSS76899.1 HD domain-containing protein [Anaerococcus porci]NVF10617.1 bis(5'-nucleosyl)-tetraphosphatase (symmetrical) YqeK [Anaerococcus faecalis]
MFNLDEYKDKLIDNIGIKRFNHCLRVRDFALKLNKRLDNYKIETAAILHDCAKYNEKYYLDKYKNYCNFDKEILENKAVIHAFLGKIIAEKEYNINDEEILNAIKYHTTGRVNMTELEKIIFLADACEEKRNYQGVEEIRNLAFKDLDKAVLKTLDGNIKSLIDRGLIIFPLTILARNYLLKEKNG